MGTGFAVRNKREAEKTKLLSQNPSSPHRADQTAKQWTSQYAMQYTSTRFLPSAREDPDSHPRQGHKGLGRYNHNQSPLKSASEPNLHNRFDVFNRCQLSQRGVGCGKSLAAAGSSIVA